MTEPDDNQRNYPTTKKLADGFVESTRKLPKDDRPLGNDDVSPSVEDVFLEWIRKSAQQSMASSAQDRESVKSRTDEALKGFARRVYLYPAELAVSSRESWASLGRRYVVNQTTVKRWIDGSDPKLTNIAAPFAAEDAVFPRGLHIAVNAYAFAFAALNSDLGKAFPLDPKAVLQELSSQLLDWADEAREFMEGPSIPEFERSEQNRFPVFAIDQNACEEALVLYLALRTPDWWKAIRTGKKNYEDIAAAYICQNASNLFALTSEWDAARIKDLIERHADAWTYIEEVLPDEWI